MPLPTLRSRRSEAPFRPQGTQKRLFVLLALLALALLGGSASGATVIVNDLVLHADGGFQPQPLPRHRFAPIDFQGHVDVSRPRRRQALSAAPGADRLRPRWPPQRRRAADLRAGIDRAGEHRRSATDLPRFDRRHRSHRSTDLARKRPGGGELGTDDLQRPAPGRQTDRDSPRPHHRPRHPDLCDRRPDRRTARCLPLPDPARCPPDRRRPRRDHPHRRRDRPPLPRRRQESQLRLRPLQRPHPPNPWALQLRRRHHHRRLRRKILQLQLIPCGRHPSSRPSYTCRSTGR